jgi:hypothetical protein
MGKIGMNRLPLGFLTAICGFFYHIFLYLFSLSGPVLIVMFIAKLFQALRINLLLCQHARVQQGGF